MQTGDLLSLIRPTGTHYCSVLIGLITLFLKKKKLEEEISTLKQVLAAKEKHHADLKMKLGITPLNELKQNFSKSWHEMQTSTAVTKLSSKIDRHGANVMVLLIHVLYLNHVSERSFQPELHHPLYKKTQETLSTAGQKATAALNNVGTAISRKFGDMRYAFQVLKMYIITRYISPLLYISCNS
ncbi:TPD53 protein, partial [Amia calva]|nr:TPD53 protein [Amia calva]